MGSSFEQRVGLGLHLILLSQPPPITTSIAPAPRAPTFPSKATKTLPFPPPPEEESDKVQKRLFAWLESLPGVHFSYFSHRPVLTSQEAADVRKVSVASGAKAMLVFDKKEEVFTLLVLSAAKALEWKLVRKMLGKKTGLATVEQVYQVTKCLSGAVPPFGSLFGIKTCMDESLVDQGEEINFNCGLRTMSVSMSVEDYIIAEQPLTCKISASNEK